MIIGVPKEIKDNEARAGITPAGVKALTEAGHTSSSKPWPKCNPASLTLNTRTPALRSSAKRATRGAKPTWSSRSRSPSNRNISFSAKASSSSLISTCAGPLISPTSCSNPRSSASPMKPSATRARCLFSPLMKEAAGRMSVQVGATYLEKGAPRRPWHPARRCPWRSPCPRLHHRRRHRGHQRSPHRSRLRGQNNPSST